MRIAMGVFLLLHGFAHLVGFAVPWRLTSNAEMPYKTTLLAGHWDVGDAGIRFNGLLWLAAALVFMVAGLGLLHQTQWWEALTIIISLVSLVLCIVSWPEARIGLFINLAILLWLYISNKLQWLIVAK